jgi:hypothetical protein
MSSHRQGATQRDRNRGRGVVLALERRHRRNAERIDADRHHGAGRDRGSRPARRIVEGKQQFDARHRCVAKPSRIAGYSPFREEAYTGGTVAARRPTANLEIYDACLVGRPVSEPSRSRQTYEPLSGCRSRCGAPRGSGILLRRGGRPVATVQRRIPPEIVG